MVGVGEASAHFNASQNGILNYSLLVRIYGLSAIILIVGS
jgi:hypothetical protein